MVSQWHQACTNASSQLLEALQVGDLLGSELRLQAIAGRFLPVECYIMLAEYAVGMVLHHPEGCHAILQPLSSENSVVGPQLAAVSPTQG